MIRPYVIVYTFDATDCVAVPRVLHGRRDIGPKLLRPDADRLVPAPPLRYLNLTMQLPQDKLDLILCRHDDIKGRLAANPDATTFVALSRELASAAASVLPRFPLRSPHDDHAHARAAGLDRRACRAGRVCFR